jgi:glutaredoxin-related protein
MQQKHMIQKYIVVTGIQSQKEQDLESMYNLKKQVEMDESNKKFDDEVVRKKRWRKRTFVVSAIAIIEGAIIYLIISM